MDIILTPSDECVDLTPVEFSNLAGNEILDNTKPNLISYSLSTTSSSYNPSSNVKGSAEAENSKNIPVGKSSSRCDLGDSVAHVAVTSDDIEVSDIEVDNSSHKESKRESTDCGQHVHKCSVICKECNLGQSLQNECNFTVSPSFQSNHPWKRQSKSMQNLFEGNNFSQLYLTRGSSQPELSLRYEQFSNLSHKRFSKKKNQRYEHVESKVKCYIQKLKRENSDLMDGSSKKLNEVIQVKSEKLSVVNEMQLEIQKLHQHLEERDTLLKEIQVNHHTLLLKYAEACNRLDELRLSATPPRRDVKFIGTESSYKEMPLASSPSNEEVNSTTQTNKTSDESKGICSGYSLPMSKISVSKLNHDSLFIKPSCSQIGSSNASENYRDPQNMAYTSHSNASENYRDPQNMAYTKVAKWCATLPNKMRVVPSCYGSPGSSELDPLKVEKCPGSIEYFVQNSESSDPTEFKNLFKSSNYSDPRNDSDPGNMFSVERISVKDSDGQFLPLAKREFCRACLTKRKKKKKLRFPTNGKNFNILFTQSPLNVINIPPLNLVESVESSCMCQTESKSEICISSDSCDYSLPSSRKVDDTSLRKEKTKSFQRNCNVLNCLCSNDTPTSYRSILLKSDAEQEESCIHCNEHCPLRSTLKKQILNMPPAVTDSEHRQHQIRKYRISNGQKLKSYRGNSLLNYICKCRWDRNTFLKDYSRIESLSIKCSSKPKVSPFTVSQPSSPVAQYLNTATMYAQDLKTKTEAIQEFLSSLLISLPRD